MNGRLRGEPPRSPNAYKKTIDGTVAIANIDLYPSQHPTRPTFQMPHPYEWYVQPARSPGRHPILLDRSCFPEWRNRANNETTMNSGSLLGPLLDAPRRRSPLYDALPYSSDAARYRMPACDDAQLKLVVLQPVNDQHVVLLPFQSVFW